MTQKRRHWWTYILIFIVSQLTAAAIPVIMSFVPEGNVLDQEWTIVLTLLTANLLAIALFLLFRPQGVTWQATRDGMRGCNRMRTKLVTFMAIPVIVLVNVLQETLFPELPDLVGGDTMKLIMYNPLGLLTVALLGPLSEELLFRGGVQETLYPKSSTPEPSSSVLNDQFSISALRPILISAAIFSLVHLNPAQMPAAFILGLLLGFAYWWTGSLIAPVVIHVLNNTTACTLTILSPDDDSFIHFLGGPMSAAVAVAVSFFTIYLLVLWMRKID